MSAVGVTTKWLTTSRAYRPARARTVAGLAVAFVLMSSCGRVVPAQTAVRSAVTPVRTSVATPVARESAPITAVPATTPASSTTTSSSSSSTSLATNKAGTWRMLPSAPGHATGAPVWTGKELIIWSGGAYPGPEPVEGGVAYDLARDSWRETPTAPL